LVATSPPPDSAKPSEGEGDRGAVEGACRREALCGPSRRRHNQPDDPIGLVTDIPGVDAECADAPRRQPGIARRVALRPIFGRVSHAVDFDREPYGVAIEVEDVWADRVLAAELQTASSLLPERHPEQRFRRRQLTPQTTGAANGFGRCFHGSN